MSDFKWWASDNVEVYRYGPHDTREAALDDAFGNMEPGETVFVVEAIPGRLRMSASQTIDTMLESAEELFGEDGNPDRYGERDQIKAADAELQQLLDGWLDKHRDTFTEPTLFAVQRNAGTEVVPLDDGQTPPPELEG